MIKLPFTLGIYDIETGLANVDIFQFGEQAVRHTQQTKLPGQLNIICISAKTYGKDDMVTFTGDNSVSEFDAWMKQCDVILGKNNGRFDDKRLHTIRMLRGLAPNMEMLDKSDDLEKHMRKYFALPSYSLDYFSKLIGEGGKEKMEFSDWVNIRNFELLNSFNKEKSFGKKALNIISLKLFNSPSKDVLRIGKYALEKMIFYNRKDVSDTEKSLTKVLPYVKLKYNSALLDEEGKGCRVCGKTTKLIPSEITSVGKSRYQHFQCEADNKNTHYAGKAIVKYDKNRHKVYGKIQ